MKPFSIKTVVIDKMRLLRLAVIKNIGYIYQSLKTLYYKLIDYMIPVILSIVCIFGIIRFNYNKATFSATLWWVLLFILLFFSYFISKDKMKIPNLNMLSAITLIAGSILYLQSNQPIFAPLVKEERLIKSHQEHWIFWRVAIGDGEHKKEFYEIVEKEIVVLIPFFPIYNEILLNRVESSSLLDLPSDEDDESQSSLKNQIKYSIKAGPAMFKSDNFFINKLNKNIVLHDGDGHISNEPIMEVLCGYKEYISTNSDAFTHKEAIIGKKIIKKGSDNNQIKISIAAYGSKSWSSLTSPELDFFSKYYFDNEFSILEYFKDSKYRKKLSNLITSVDKNLIVPVSPEPDSYLLEYCNIKLSNTSSADQVIRFINDGFYPRDYFILEQPILINTSTRNPSQKLTVAPVLLPDGIINLEPKKSINIRMLRVQYRNNFNRIKILNTRPKNEIIS